MALAAERRGAEAYAAAERAKAASLSDGSLKVPSLAALRRVLPPETAYLGYVVQGDVFLVSMLSAEAGALVHRSPRVPRLAASLAAWRYLLAIPPEWRGKIAGLPRVWRRAEGSYQAAAAAPEPGAAQVDSADEIAAYLGAKLLGAAAKHLKAARRLVVSPDRDLAFAPFEALRVGERYLAESHEVRYTAGAAVYALSRARAQEYAKLDGRAEILAIGGALYDPFVQLTPMLNVHHELLFGAPRGEARPKALPEAFRALKIAWADLPGTADEAVRLAARFDGGRALVGADASEERLAAMNASGELARYRRLLFATHGYLSPYDPELSAVVLSQVRNRAPHDGYVTAAELARYKLKSDLVVLSASNSGFGPVAGSAGLLGLPYALHAAGNHETALSLWTLNDPLTARLLAQFLERVRAGEDHGAALALAKRALIAERVPPSYWAHLVLHGG